MTWYCQREDVERGALGSVRTRTHPIDYLEQLFHFIENCVMKGFSGDQRPQTLRGQALGCALRRAAENHLDVSARQRASSIAPLGSQSRLPERDPSAQKWAPGEQVGFWLFLLYAGRRGTFSLRKEAFNLFPGLGMMHASQNGCNPKVYKQ